MKTSLFMYAFDWFLNFAQIKVSNVVNKTHEKASKEKENEQDVVETKHAEKAPTLTHSLSREDDKIKIKKTILFVWLPLPRQSPGK